LSYANKLIFKRLDNIFDQELVSKYRILVKLHAIDSLGLIFC